jgi:Domain of unknown function (DUF927)
MDVRGFLENVVPWNLGGYVTIHWHRPGSNFRGRSFKTLDAALAFVTDLADKTQDNIYYCISHQSQNNGQRDREHAMGLVCLPMDSDIKPGSPKHYHSIPEAIVAIFEFCLLVGIPRPSLMVVTGGGLHVYWLSDRVLPVEEWQLYADAVKHAAIKAGVKFDRQCTGDAARVLRVPGTSNWKYGAPRTVRMLPPNYSPGTKHDFAEVFKKLLNHPKLTVVSGGLGKLNIAPEFKGQPVKPMADDLLKELPPLPFEPIMAECGFLREAYETGGAAFDNNLWNLTTLIAHFLENGHDLAHKFADKHQTYIFEKTEELWERKGVERKAKKLGWPQCKTIESAGSTHCAACPHRVKEKSPVNLGLAAARAGQVDQDIKALGGIRPEDLQLPEGYCVDLEGRICAIVRAKKVGKVIHPARLVVLLKTIIRAPSLQHKDGDFGIGFIANTDLNGTVEVFMNASNCYGHALLAFLPKHAVLFNGHKEAKAILSDLFAPSWLDKLMKAHIASRDSGTMGWRYEDNKRIGFVYGNTLYHSDGRDVPLLAASDSDFRSWYMPVGTKDAWLLAAKLLTDRKRPELDIIIAVGFAAPLMTFAGTLYGCILSVWGDPGTSKSTAQQVAAAIWGHPKQTRESLNSTPKSVQRRLGLCRNLAAYWDDIQDERHQDALFQTMFVATQGAEGGRLNTDATMKERLEWQTLLVACSNASFVEYLTRKQKSTTAGMRRVFEIEFNKKLDEPGMINAVTAGNIFGELERNYGQMGVEYSRLLAREHAAIYIMVTKIMKAFCEKVDGTGDEAYWWGTCGVILAGAMLANKLGTELDIEAMEAFLEKAFIHNRTIRGSEGTEGGSYTNTEGGLVAFLNHFVGSGNALYVDKFFHHRHQIINVLHPPEKGHPVVVQIARDERKIVFSKREMRDFLHKREIQVRQIFGGMETYFAAKEVRHTLGAGTVHAQGQEMCVEIYLPPDRPHILSHMLEARGPTKP